MHEHLVNVTNPRRVRLATEKKTIGITNVLNVGALTHAAGACDLVMMRPNDVDA